MLFRSAYTQLMEAYRGPVTVIPAAEVFLCVGLENYPALSRLTVGDTKLILVEMPAPPWPNRLVDTLVSLSDMGYEPVLAHIDRYPKKDMAPLLEMGFCAQMNPEGVLRFGGARYGKKLIQEGTPVALGSDIHGISQSAYDRYDTALRRLGELGDSMQEALGVLLQTKPKVPR